jgi:hypothetical protein
VAGHDDRMKVSPQQIEKTGSAKSRRKIFAKLIGEKTLPKKSNYTGIVCR